MTTKDTPSVVVLGGGFGGLEAAFVLRSLVRNAARITLVSDKDYFLFKPNTIYIPFGLDPEKLKVPLRRAAGRAGIEFKLARARRIDAESRTVDLEGGSLAYDYLVVATGAGMRFDEIPGLREHAQTIWEPEQMLQLRSKIEQLIVDARQGLSRRVVFLVPPNNKCSGPLYEMVMMLDTWLRRKKARSGVQIVWTTYERGYIQAFGPRLNEVVTGEFERRGIEGHKEWAVDRIEKGAVFYKNGERVAYDLLIAFPPYIAATPFPGLPADDRGFLQTTLETRQLKGRPNVYVVGDAGDFPVKQAFLAFLQADAAAEHIAAAILNRKTDKLFKPVSMCVMEQFDKATFAQVPLRVTGDSQRPVEVDPGALGLYRVGSSKPWRLGKKLLGVYLPWRFGHGRPFHQGLPWQGMELGLKVMSRVLAS